MIWLIFLFIGVLLFGIQIAIIYLKDKIGSFTGIMIGFSIAVIVISAMKLCAFL